MTIRPVILSGGEGSRLWPLSRASRPKQFQAIAGPETLFARTLARVSPAHGFASPVIVGALAHLGLIEAELAALGIADAGILLEPVSRNTAAAIAVAARHSLAEGREESLLVLPSDHQIGDADAFRAAVFAAARHSDRLMTFGIMPTRAETGYGYIRAGAPLGDGLAAAIAGFVEKPDLATAQGYLRSGGYLWNSGMFVLPAHLAHAEMARFEPGLVDGADRALADGRRSGGRIYLDPAAFAGLASLPFDKAVMERTGRGGVLPVGFAWSDIGAWDAVWEAADKDAAGNAVQGDAVLEGVINSLVQSTGRLVVVQGVDGLAIIETPDAVAVLPLADAQSIRRTVERLKQMGRPEATRWPEATD